MIQSRVSFDAIEYQSPDQQQVFCRLFIRKLQGWGMRLFSKKKKSIEPIAAREHELITVAETKLMITADSLRDRGTPFHGLDQNVSLTEDEVSRCQKIIAQVKRLAEEWGSFVKDHELDPDIYFPQNHWKPLADIYSSFAHSSKYIDINFLRCHFGGSGFNMLILDRRDDGQEFTDKDGSERVKTQYETLPEDIYQIILRSYNPCERAAIVLQDIPRLQQNIPPKFLVGSHPRFGEMGISYQNLLINQDTLLTQSRINVLYVTGVLAKIEQDIAAKGHCRIMEIGPGYGGLAQALRDIFGPALQYIVIDLPFMLYGNTIYLSTMANFEGCFILRPDDTFPSQFQFAFMANYLIATFKEAMGSVDFAINTMSFPEMSEAQVEFYVSLIKDLLSPSGLCYIESNVVFKDHIDPHVILDRYFPYVKKFCNGVATAPGGSVSTGNGNHFIYSSKYLHSIHRHLM